MSTVVGTRMNWAVTSRGTRTVPLLLISGYNAVFTPEDMGIVGCALGGTVDSLWWFGATATFDAGVVKPWLSLPHGVQWSEKIVATDPQALDVGALEVLLSDVGYAATALFASRDTILGTELTAEVNPTDTTIHVVSTDGFTAPGAGYLGREAFEFSGVTATTFTGCTRGTYGSVPYRHPYAGAAGGVGIEVPEVTTAPYDVVGRPASLWMATVSSAGVITAVELEYFGHVGADATLSEEGDGWVLRVDHAMHKLGQAPRSPSVTLSGFTHVGNRECRAPTPHFLRNPVLGGTATTPMWIWLITNPGDVLTYSVVLTDEDAYPDSGGWHPTREAFIGAMQRAANDVMTGIDLMRFSLVGDLLEVYVKTALGYGMSGVAGWDWTTNTQSYARTDEATFRFARFPTAWVPIHTNSRVYLSPAEYAQIPALPLNPRVGVTGYTQIFCLLAVGEERSLRYARIVDKAQSGGVQYIVCTALETGDVPLRDPSGGTTYLAAGPAFNLTQPTPARLILQVVSSHWVDAIEAMLAYLDSDGGDQLSEACDFAQMRELVSHYTGALPLGRTFIYDVKTTPLEWLVSEANLNGFAVIVVDGRIGLARIAEFAPTEVTVGTLETARLQRGNALPGYSRGQEGVINKMTFKWLGADRTLNVIDTNSVDRYGSSRTSLAASIPIGLIPSNSPADALFSTLFAVGMSALGPYRQPVERVSVHVTLRDFALQTGALVLLTMWRVPNDGGSRGLVEVIGQVIEREPMLYGEENSGDVRYTFRLSPNRLAGWSPSIFVASAGISGAVVTADVTTFGASCMAPIGQSPTYGFTVGDKVRMIQVNTGSPTTATRHTVSAKSAGTLTLNPSPNATFVALAAAGALQVIVEFDDYDTGGLQVGQTRYAYLADRTTLLLTTGVRAQRYAS